MILDNLEKIRYRARAAATRAGRNPNDIQLVAVTKYAELPAVRRLLESEAAFEVGENRVQEAQAKMEALGPLAKRVRWRLIGHLQTNKAKKAAQLFDAVDSIDSVKIGRALDEAAAALAKRMPVLVQVKLSERQTQSGVDAADVAELLKELGQCACLDVRGLMAIAPALDPVENVRPYFQIMRRLFETHFAGRPDAQLSMGMSRDFEIAIEEGATHIRIGSTLFS